MAAHRRDLAVVGSVSGIINEADTLLDMVLKTHVHERPLLNIFGQSVSWWALLATTGGLYFVCWIFTP